MVGVLARLREHIASSTLGTRDVQRPDDTRLATALLLAELARADFDVGDAEIEVIRTLLQQRFDLSPGEVDDVVDRALRRADGATSLYDYVETLNRRLDYRARCEIIEMLWRVAYADGRLDKYEEHELRKIAGLLYVEDQDFIRAKLRVTD